MTQEELDRLLVEVIAEARGVNIPVSAQIEPKVRLNSRATGRFGCCIRMGGRFIIELSDRMTGASVAAVKQTIAHEVLHTCRGCANHGERWKQYAARMNQAYGYEIARTDSCEKLGVPNTAKVRYRLVCTKCGMEITRSRRSNVVVHPERYRCHCGGALLLMQGPPDR